MMIKYIKQNRMQVLEKIENRGDETSLALVEALKSIRAPAEEKITEGFDLFKKERGSAD